LCKEMGARVAWNTHPVNKKSKSRNQRAQGEGVRVLRRRGGVRYPTIHGGSRPVRPQTARLNSGQKTTKKVNSKTRNQSPPIPRLTPSQPCQPTHSPSYNACKLRWTSIWWMSQGGCLRLICVLTRRLRN
jgi:hypothetical protein